MRAAIEERRRGRHAPRRFVGVGLFAASLLLGSGCGGAAAASSSRDRQLTGEERLDEEDGAPRFALPALELPEPPASVDADEPSLEPVLSAARALLDRAAPAPEAPLEREAFSAFVEEQLTPWMRAIGADVRTLWEATQALSSRSLGVHIVARAITGATLMRVAERISGLVGPSSLRASPEELERFRAAFDAVSRGMRDRATQALGACASDAVGSADPTLGEWRAYCDALANAR